MMRWKQFFTPVESLDATAAKDFMDRAAAGAFTLLDVRQPEEYEAEHLPGAKLIPLAEIGSRLSELDPRKPTIVYCAIGGRSRVASQMLAGKGFREVYNLSGGIKAWRSGKAVGAEDLGLELFSGNEPPEAALVVAYGLEEGLRLFYESMAPRVAGEKARDLFGKLSLIEAKHQDRIFSEYLKTTGTAPSREEFSKRILSPAMEGGLTFEDYIGRYRPDMENPVEIISLAMAIEAQALDLYERASARSKHPEGGRALAEIAAEERAHMVQLGKLFKNLS